MAAIFSRGARWQDVAVPSRPATHPVSRREVLLGATGGVIGLTVLALAATACGSDEPEVDPLTEQQHLAFADAALARAAAVGAAPPVARALTQVAAERDAHATALGVEIARAAGQPAPTTATATTTTTTGGAAPAPPPPLGDVVAALQHSAQSAGELASTLSGYRAGLLGSVAASAGASATVALAGPKAAR